MPRRPFLRSIIFKYALGFHSKVVKLMFLSMFFFFPSSFFFMMPLSQSEVKHVFSEVGHCLPLCSIPRYLPPGRANKQRRTTCVGDAATSTQLSPDGCNFCLHKAWTYTGGEKRSVKGNERTRFYIPQRGQESLQSGSRPAHSWGFLQIQ